jgi:hypothetical protein
MRSELVPGALKQVSNRYLLVKLLATATRGFHRPGTRIQEQDEDVLVRFNRSDTITSVEAAQDSEAASGSQRNRHQGLSPKARFDFEQKQCDHTVEVARSTTYLSFDPNSSPHVPIGLVCTTAEGLPDAQHLE